MNGLSLFLVLDSLVTLPTRHSRMFADKEEGSLRMIEGRDLLPSSRRMAGLAFPANGVVVVVRVTAYARVREAAIGLPAVGLYFGQYLGIRNILERVASPALGVGMLASAGEAGGRMIECSLVE